MGNNGQEAKILIVDDEEGIRSLFKEALEEQGYACKMAASGQDALELVARDAVDLALVDVIMPGMSGIELVRRLQGSDPDIGIILVTALGRVQLAVDAMKSGAYDYITKPVRLEQLKEGVRQALQRRKARQEERLREAQLQSDLSLKAGEVESRVREITALNQQFQAYLQKQFDLAEIARRVADVAERTSEELKKLAEDANKIASASGPKSS